VAIDALLIQTQQGLGFLKRVEGLVKAGCTVRLIAHGNGKWTTSAHEAQPTNGEAPIGRASAATLRSAILAAPLTGTNTRRAPRFPMLDALNADVEGGHASLVNISVLGAQVVSQPVLRPGQTVKIALPDDAELLHLTAHVAWSSSSKQAGTTRLPRRHRSSPTPPGDARRLRRATAPRSRSRRSSRSYRAETAPTDL
jgi:hypothetical protein